MFVIWLGALLVVAGVLYMTATAIWKGPMSALKRSRSGPASDTLEPPGRDITVFALSRNWPGLALMVIGAILLLVGVFV